MLKISFFKNKKKLKIRYLPLLMKLAPQSAYSCMIFKYAFDCCLIKFQIRQEYRSKY